MVKTITVALLGSLFAGFAVAQFELSVELDLDGVVGNGPDVIAANMSDYISVDVWIIGDPTSVSYVGVTFCNLDGSLEFQGYSDAIGSGWTITPPQVTGSCVLVQATDFSFSAPKIAPFLHGTATYHAAVDASIDDLTIDARQSGWFTAFGPYLFSDNVGAVVIVSGEPAATEESSWGGVKGLFR